MNIFASWSVQINVALKHNTFYPGNIVEGVVTINTNAPIPFNAIRLKFTGKEKVHIKRNERVPDGPPRPPPDGQGPPVQHYKTIKRSYYSTNVVMKQLITLAGNLKYSGPAGGMMNGIMSTMGMSQSYQLPPGNYSYPFAFQLPFNLPPSFNRTVTDDTANIVYYCKAYVDIPRGRDAVRKCFFSVIRPMPASQWSHRNPVSVSRPFNVTCCCCISKGVVNAMICMDRTCIAIDRDWLQLFADIDNTNCSEPVESVEVSLRHTIKYKAGGYTEAHTMIAGRQLLGTPIPAGQKGLVNGVINLPRNLLPSFKTPNVESSYVITVELNIPWASDPCQTFPVVIGQSVDDADMSPPIPFTDFGSVVFTPPRQPCVEYYYQGPPPSACFAFAPIASYSAYAPQQQNFMPVPPAPAANFYLPQQSWAQQNPPAVYYDASNAGHQQQQQQQHFDMNAQWQGGYEQHCAPEYQMPPPPTQPMGYGQPLPPSPSAADPYQQQQQQQQQYSNNNGVNNNYATTQKELGAPLLDTTDL